MKFTAPNAGDRFTITSAAVWPSIAFQTDASGPHDWTWTIQWGTFKKSGTAQTTGNSWNPVVAVAHLGGELTVTATAGAETASIAIRISGTNPSAAEVAAYLATKPNAEGFDKILQHESKFRNFNSGGEPVKSFDNGYGMCQLTTPAPAYEQVWNWKLNIDGGLALFAAKQAVATKYLSQSNRVFTQDQLKYEAVCRWNGGSYHVWDAANAAWVRNPGILCDAATGNIGWDMTDPQNTGKTAAELHKRDSGLYSRPPAAGAHWKYSGVCYADAILG
ncbi:MAG: hypothetical protein ABI759_21890 [Candidatus Solibacter sp.]